MMMKAFTAVALAVATLGASAHPLPYTHYHEANGRVVVGNQFFPQVVTTYEVDGYGRRVRVVATTRCTDVQRNYRNNHLICREEERTVQRFIEGGDVRGYDQHRDRPGYGIVPGAVIGGVVHEILRDEHRDDHDRGNHDRGNNDRNGHDGRNDRDHDRHGH